MIIIPIFGQKVVVENIDNNTTIVSIAFVKSFGTLFKDGSEYVGEWQDGRSWQQLISD